ncbi:phage holin [Metabacillus indicus]|uniref:phage holin n=1 Tax=Metabacillus indicus TaxID=246786 RepID=UPI002A01AC06|nr:phage holin [Metabacillus indicus]MDX8288826.1 phage holin [Metabacillus indicus]
MNKFDKGTVLRTVLLFVALINQSLIMLGYPILPIEEGQITGLIDGLYLVGSLIFTVVTSLIAWFKNNYVTAKGKAQKKVIEKNNLN